MARRPVNTSPAVAAAREAVKRLRKSAPPKRPETMVYLLEVRVPLEHVGDFTSEVLEDSLTGYGSVDVIDSTIVETEL